VAQIRKRGRESYLISVYLGKDAKGKRRYYSETFRGTEKEARYRMSELEVKHRRPSGPKTAAMAMGEYLERWLSNIEGTVSDRALKTYALHVRHLVAAVGNLALYGLTGFELKTRLKDYFKSLRKPLAPATVKGIYGTARTALRAAKADGVIADDLAASLKPPRTPRKERRVLNPGELVQLLGVAGEFKHGLVIRVLALTGLRLGEALGLEWRDVDFDQGVLTVRQSVDVHTRKVNDRLKTAASARTLALDRETLALLAEHKREQGKAKVASLHSLVFRAADGRPLRARGVQYALGRTLKKAGLVRVRLHDLRHTAGSLMLDAGQPLTSVSQFLGHSSTATTAAVYAHPVRKGASLADVLKLEPSRKEPQGFTSQTADNSADS
jgi:integrase